MTYNPDQPYTEKDIDLLLTHAREHSTNAMIHGLADVVEQLRVDLADANEEVARLKRVREREFMEQTTYREAAQREYGKLLREFGKVLDSDEYLASVRKTRNDMRLKTVEDWIASLRTTGEDHGETHRN